METSELSDHVNSMDIRNSCRTCLQPNIHLESVFESYFDNLQFSKVLMLCAPISVDEQDGLSPQICEGCRINTINAYKFQQQCILSDKNIRIIIESQIKNDISAIKSIKTEDLEVLVDPGDHDDFTQKIVTTLDVETTNENEVMLTDALKQLDSEFESETSSISAHDNSSDSSSNSSSEASEAEDEEYGDDGAKSDKIKSFPCQSCNKSFKSSTKLSRHFKNRHQSMKKSQQLQDDDEDDDSDDSKKIYTCDVCPKTFKKPSLLARHVKVHDPNKRPFECQKCDKRFPSQVALVRHDILHSDLVERSKIHRVEPQEFVCVICARSFKSPESLSSHIKAHKSTSEEVHDYPCKICSEIFPTFTEIIRHSKNHIENATHQCAICNRMFAVGDELIDHMLRHKGLKPHQCHICEKSFLKLHKLNVHLRTHSDDKVSNY